MLILEFSGGDDEQQDDVKYPQQESTGLDPGAVLPEGRKNSSTRDMSYRPPKSAKARGMETSSPGNCGEPEDEGNVHSHSPARDDASWLLDQHQSLMQHNSVRGWEITADREDTIGNMDGENIEEESEETGTVLLSHEQEKRRPRPSESMADTMSSNPTPATWL